MKKWIIIVMVFLWTIPVFAQKPKPIESLQKPIDEVIEILKDPKYSDDSNKEEQRKKIWKIIKDVFDFEKISKLSLGLYRKKFDDKQMDIFTEEFATLLGNTYLKKIQGEYENDKIRYEEEILNKEGDKALVKTKIVRENMEVPVDYKMWYNNEKWKIYDVKVEGVSLVKNYRSQFQKILFEKGPENLIERIRSKNKEQSTELKVE
jgi:phospholipid transport system substrate-binding protein